MSYVIIYWGFIVVTKKKPNDVVLFKGFQELAKSENYNTMVCEHLFPNTTLYDKRYNIAFRWAAHLLKDILSEHTKPFTDLDMDAQESQEKHFQNLMEKRKIICLGGWCLSSVRKQKVRRIMANDYSSKQNDLISVLTNEKKLMDQLMQFMRTATHKAQN